MKNLVVIAGLLICTSFSFGQTEEEFLVDLDLYRLNKHEECADSAQSPLAPEDVAGFTGLNYYEPDYSFLIKAKYKVQTGPVFEMVTSTDRRPKYRKYAKLTFKVDGEKCVLWAYQNIKLSMNPLYAKHLFIPFGDATNGFDSYGSGRFLDIDMVDGKSIMIDFNKCYNPLCSYDHRFSCPIPPLENILDVKIEAGEKNYKEH